MGADPAGKHAFEHLAVLLFIQDARCKHEQVCCSHVSLSLRIYERIEASRGVHQHGQLLLHLIHFDLVRRLRMEQLDEHGVGGVVTQRGTA